MKRAFVFPGQGAQEVGMGKDIFERYEEARKIYEKASEISGIDVKKICFEGPEEELRKTENTSELIIHSDQGFHYQHGTWTKKLEKMNIRQSMSRKGNCLDNSPMENFFGILKQEMFYGEYFKN